MANFGVLQELTFYGSSSRGNPVTGLTYLSPFPPPFHRDPRGFACKFYTREGNWDLVGNNTPIFFIRDPIFFPSFIHTQKRNPVTHCKDPDAFWDFITLRQETAHQVSFLFSDRGTPVGYRHMNGYGSHTFKLVNKDGHPVYCKFHLKTDQVNKLVQSDLTNREMWWGFFFFFDKFPTGLLNLQA